MIYPFSVVTFKHVHTPLTKLLIDMLKVKHMQDTLLCTNSHHAKLSIERRLAQDWGTLLKMTLRDTMVAGCNHFPSPFFVCPSFKPRVLLCLVNVPTSFQMASLHSCMMCHRASHTRTKYERTSIVLDIPPPYLLSFHHVKCQSACLYECV